MTRRKYLTTFTTYFSDGKIKTIEEYKNGNLREKTTFYSNGNICSYNSLRCYDNEDFLEGLQEIYFMNGKKELIFYCKKGKLNGKYQRFDENGEIVETLFYSKGNKL